MPILDFDLSIMVYQRTKRYRTLKQKAHSKYATMYLIMTSSLYSNPDSNLNPKSFLVNITSVLQYRQIAKNPRGFWKYIKKSRSSGDIPMELSYHGVVSTNQWRIYKGTIEAITPNLLFDYPFFIVLCRLLKIKFNCKAATMSNERLKSLILLASVEKQNLI